MDRPGDPPRKGRCSSSIERFSLSGPSVALDPRIHAFRRDIADIDLAGRLMAPHYARPVIRAAGPNGGAVLAEPREGAEQATDLAPGDEFAVLDESSGWAWGYRRADHRVGYVPAQHLEPARQSG